MSNDHNKKRISRNVLATVTQVLISGVVFFVLYRYLYDRLGVEQIGVWSLVLAATSVSRIGELGLSAGVVRFVAQALGRGDTQRAADVVQTTALTLGAFMAVLLTAGYPIFTLILGYLLPPHGVPVAMCILPYALVSLCVLVIVSVLSGGLDGCMRMDIRSLLTGSSHLLYLTLAMLLVPKYGLVGVAQAQLIQSVGLMCVLWWALKRQLEELPMVPLYWKLPVLREMIGYGVNFQIITVVNMLFDPVIKALMSRFGGLGALGYYEMANRLILQGRSLIIEASRVMVPAIARLQEQEKGQAKELFIISYRSTFFVSALFYGLLGISITAISMLWLGHDQATFIQFALLLNLGWFSNTLIGPAYFSNLGSGKLRANMYSHIIMGLSSLLVGGALGSLYGGLGVILGAITGLLSGSFFLLFSHISDLDLNWKSFIIPEDMKKLMILSIALILLSNGIAYQMPSLLIVIFVALLTSSMLFLFFFKHPNTRVLMGNS